MSSYLGTSFPDCVVVSFARKKSMFYYCRPGDSVWAIHKKEGDSEVFSDMIFFEGRLYALSDGDLLLVELFPDLKITILGGKDTLRKEKKKLNQSWKLALAESNGELLLVFISILFLNMKSDAYCCCVEEAIHICVWDFKGRNWEKRSSLRGRALFIGYDYSKGSLFGGSITPPHAGIKIKENCVYIAERVTNSWCVYSLEDKCVEMCLVAERFRLPHTIWMVQPIWVLPSLC